MKSRYIFLCLIMTLFLQNQALADTEFGIQNLSHASEHVIWDRTPINVILPIGQERMVTFPGAVTIHNTNPELSTDKLSLLNNNGTLYLTAKKTFAAIRVPVTLTSSGEVILLDISATTDGVNTPLNVLIAADSTINATDSQIPFQDQSITSIHYISLMRYAITHLYAPERLVKESNHIIRTPMYTQKNVALMTGLPLSAMPLISWQGGNLYVTAVLLKNMSQQSITIAPNQMLGQWLAASFYPNKTLTPSGTLHDRTTLFLISTTNFNTALHQFKDYRS